MLGFSVETLKTKEIVDTEVKQLRCELEIQQTKITDLSCRIFELEDKLKRNRTINIIWTIVVGLAVFLLAINY